MTRHESGQTDLLTISEIAHFAGVTVRAVRHYHARGLLPEPERDASGYRRYDAQAVVDLIRIKTLADAGVPLARAAELLQADEGEFADAVDEIDRRLHDEIERLRHHRERIARLAAGDSLALPAEVVAYLGQLRSIGLSERTIDIERDGWILLTARRPDNVVEWIRHKAALFDDPAYCDLYRTFDEAGDWAPDDPRLAAFADALSAYGNRMQKDTDPAFTPSLDAAADQQLVALLDAQTSSASPTWRRLRTLLEQRGWTGWSTMERSDD
jgi:DNA-binding transcriptional MerR regulator